VGKPVGTGVLPDLVLTDRGASDIMAAAGHPGPWLATLLRRHNHTYRLESADGRAYLKAHTRHWYAWDWELGPTLAVRHEVAAWECLDRNGIPIPAVLAADESSDNPLGWPYLVTAELPGMAAGTFLETASAGGFRAVLEAIGSLLRRMHSITFRHPGYILDPEGPSRPPSPEEWQHTIHTVEARQRGTLEWLERLRGRLSPELVAELEPPYTTMGASVAHEYEPPRFTHGDCHASHFFVDGGRNAVTGVIDMEVASAGNPVSDLNDIAIELMARFEARTRWWEPLFAGYEDVPDLERFRLELLTTGEPNFLAHGSERWPANLEETYRALLRARGWAELFSANRLPA
jgi:aminoglycoside phosphotransferase (APT) family kinase protein